MIRHTIRLCLLVCLPAAAGCRADLAGPAAGDTAEIVFSNLPRLTEQDGHWEVWVFDANDQAYSIARFQTESAGRISTVLPVAARGIRVTLEPVNDPDPAPSAFALLQGKFRGSEADLTVEYALTAGPPLEREPGAHSLFTSSNNAALGYPSLENAGLWLFNVFPERNRHRSREVKLTPLQASWVYEGWIVYRADSAAETWISYGKFRPDQRQLLSSRDDTGSGPFSGDVDYRNGGIEDVPGDEWTTNLFGLQLPGGLALPLELDATAADGSALWTHAITIEPASDEGEPILSARPFGLHLYGNPIGPGGPAVPRIIRFLDQAPSARVTVH